MRKHELSAEDRHFLAEFESCRIAPSDFDHRAHIRLAYCYLAENDVINSLERMRAALHSYLEHHGIDASKYHETLTRAWILAVRHFMELTPGSLSSGEFISSNPVMLDSRIMLTHYSADLLFSPEARARFLEPDRDPIPRHRNAAG